MRRSCSETIGMDFTTAPEQAELWRRQYRPGREDPLSCMQVFLRNGEMRWSAAVLLGLDLTRVQRREEKPKTNSSQLVAKLVIDRKGAHTAVLLYLFRVRSTRANMTLLLILHVSQRYLVRLGGIRRETENGPEPRGSNTRPVPTGQDMRRVNRANVALISAPQSATVLVRSCR
jgi:hypothetical protein